MSLMRGGVRFNDFLKGVFIRYDYSGVKVIISTALLLPYLCWFQSVIAGLWLIIYQPTS